MELHKIKVIKSDERGIIYDCGKSSFITRKKGTIGANHTHKDREIIYLVKGKIELTISDETQVVKAPIMFKVGPNVYHKVVALTDIDFVIDKSDE